MILIILYFEISIFIINVVFNFELYIILYAVARQEI